MTHYVAFLKKEILESIRTYKLFIMLAVFAIFGLLSPLAALMTPYLIKNLLPGGQLIPIQDPTAIDSWTQFFKNITQMGVMVMVLIFSGIVITEISKGTLINILTKGLSRTVVILAKFTLMGVVWTLSLLLAFFICWLYTAYYFSADDIHHLLFSIFCLWLYGIFLLALLLLASTLTNTIYSCLMIVGLVFVTCMLLNIIPDVQQYNPVTLSLRNMDLLVNHLEPNFFYPTIAVTIGSIIALLTFSILVFRKKQI